LLLPCAGGLTIPAAKAALRAALDTHGGNSKEQTVVAAVDALAALCPSDAPAREPSILGNWRQINSPEYSGGTLTDDGQFQYTLGRLSFGIFEPKDLVCTLGPIGNPLKASDEEGTIEYEIEVPMTIALEDGPPTSATLLNFATCSAVDDKRLSVSFSGGVLKPTGSYDAEAWRTTFGPALAAKPGKREQIKNWMLGMMMGLVKPKEMSEGDSMSYQMTKAPKGYLDVLYLDDELRITRGNRGSLVVCERA